MVLGIGVDLVDVSRFATLVHWSPRISEFLQDAFHSESLDARSQAKLFGAVEAVTKAMNSRKVVCAAGCLNVHPAFDCTFSILDLGTIRIEHSHTGVPSLTMKFRSQDLIPLENAFQISTSDEGGFVVVYALCSYLLK
jgi:phosphopantetheinyl transferase (holo-ACP synthase)